MGPIFAVSPHEWLKAVAELVLTSDEEVLTRLWNVSSEIVAVRKRLIESGPPQDLRARLSVAQGMIHVAREGGRAGVLDGALISAAQVISHTPAPLARG